MNINYENMQYQYMGLFNVKLCKLPTITSSPIRSYYKHYTIYENIEYNNCHFILQVALKQKCIKGYISLNLSKSKVIFILFSTK